MKSKNKTNNWFLWLWLLFYSFVSDSRVKIIDNNKTFNEILDFVWLK